MASSLSEGLLILEQRGGMWSTSPPPPNLVLSKRELTLRLTEAPMPFPNDSAGRIMAHGWAGDTERLQPASQTSCLLAGVTNPTGHEGSTSSERAAEKEKLTSCVCSVPARMSWSAASSSQESRQRRKEIFWSQVHVTPTPKTPR